MKFEISVRVNREPVNYNKNKHQGRCYLSVVHGTDTVFVYDAWANGTVKVLNPDNGRMSLMRYKDAARNQLANCMLLTQQENGAGGKTDISPEEWFKDKPIEYLEKHLIPQDQALWKLDRYEDFLAARKVLILGKFKYLLASTSTVATANA